ncbi:hypothetical protein C0Q70_14125 [Pomacea canaliculata]|uniref:Uncharacterized protein n=1 Tax=Pomacea canaliculata TaxID=400727 RepID=A0A2T7NZ47_POMCA|nr:hypothetical protein C0Q70_14125 [Pomacea canaliculata]
MKKFAIIDFQGEQGPETSIVPSTWIEMETGHCYWPDQSDLKRAVIDCLVPRESWSLYPFKGIKYETDEYPKAAEKLKLLLQGFSDIGSHSEDGHPGNRRKRLVHKKRYLSSSDSDDDKAAFSSQPSKKSRVNENARLHCLPTLELTEHLGMEPWATARLQSMQPRPEAEPLRSRDMYNLYYLVSFNAH